MSKKLFLNPACISCMAGLLFIAYSPHLLAGVKHHKKSNKAVYDTLSVVAIRAADNNARFFTITFTRSQRFYKLPNDANPKYLELLKGSAHDHTPVVIKRSKQESDIILNVEKLKTK